MITDVRSLVFYFSLHIILFRSFKNCCELIHKYTLKQAVNITAKEGIWISTVHLDVNRNVHITSKKKESKNNFWSSKSTGVTLCCCPPIGSRFHLKPACEKGLPYFLSFFYLLIFSYFYDICLFAIAVLVFFFFCIF